MGGYFLSVPREGVASLLSCSSPGGAHNCGGSRCHVGLVGTELEDLGPRSRDGGADDRGPTTSPLPTRSYGSTAFCLAFQPLAPVVLCARSEPPAWIPNGGLNLHRSRSERWRFEVVGSLQVEVALFSMELLTVCSRDNDTNSS